jgi:hypothetical protein
VTRVGLTMATSQRLSVPTRRTSPPRPVSADELAVLLRVADCLIPASGPNPKPSDVAEYVPYLNVALAARSDVFDRLMAAVDELAAVSAGAMWERLKRMWAEDTDTFDPLSSVVAGAYFMTPEVKALIGYPGQHRDTAPLEQAADELGDGLLDPVIERGSIYVSAAGE